MGTKSCDTKEMYKKGQDISSSDVYKKIKVAKETKGTLKVSEIKGVSEIYYNKGGANSQEWAFAFVPQNDFSAELGKLATTSLIVSIVMVMLVVFASMFVIKSVEIMLGSFTEVFETFQVIFSMRIFPGRDEGKDPLFCQMKYRSLHFHKYSRITLKKVNYTS